MQASRFHSVSGVQIVEIDLPQFYHKHLRQMVRSAYIWARGALVQHSRPSTWAVRALAKAAAVLLASYREKSSRSVDRCCMAEDQLATLGDTPSMFTVNFHACDISPSS